MNSIISSFTAVFNEVFAWFAEALETVVGILYVDGNLTILGILAITGLAISVFMLVFEIVKSCFRLG